MWWISKQAKIKHLELKEKENASRLNDLKYEVGLLGKKVSNILDRLTNLSIAIDDLGRKKQKEKKSEKMKPEVVKASKIKKVTDSENKKKNSKTKN